MPEKKSVKKSRVSEKKIFRRILDPMTKLSQMMVEVHSSLFPPPEEMEYEVYVDLFESDGLLILEAVMPGIDKKEVLLKLGSDSISFSGEVLLSEDHSEDEAFLSEAPYGKFSRTIILPYSVDPSESEAFYRDGILRVEMPIDEEAYYPPQKMEIE